MTSRYVNVYDIRPGDVVVFGSDEIGFVLAVQELPNMPSQFRLLIVTKGSLTDHFWYGHSCASVVNFK